MAEHDDITLGSPAGKALAVNPVVESTRHFNIISKIGEGGMGVVYKAADLRLNRCVALKFLGSSSRLDETSTARFWNEARAAAALDHPNVCTVYDVGSMDDQLYIAMAYVEGESLKDRLKRGPLTFEEAQEFAIQIALGLEAAHARGIVHRDIKPSNILITPGGLIKIVDFGLAQLPDVNDVTKAGGSVGTPAYMSPEQALGQTVDHRSDIWSLGVTLYQMASGRLPFTADNSFALVHSIVYEEIDWNASRALGDVRRFMPVLRKALAKKPAERFESISEFVAALKTLTVTPFVEPVSAGPACVAVLPFANLSSNPETDYFSDGLTDELINALAQLNGLRVVSRSSVFSFKGKAVDVQTIGAQLKASAVLEGSVRSAGSRLRITVQLTNVSDGVCLWSQRFDREMKDIFEIQDEITRAAVEKLKVELVPRDTSGSKAGRTLEGYDLFLKGKYNWNRQTEDGFQKAIQYFQQAIDVDPELAPAHAGLADAYTFLGFHGFAPSLHIFPQARAAATRALDLDPALPDANISLGYVKLYHDWSWEEAEHYLRRAIELNPSSAKAYYSFMLCLVQSARFEQGRAALRKALELDPFNMLYHTSAGWLEYYAKRPRVAAEKLSEALRLDPSYPELQVAMGAVKEQLGEFDEAIAHLEKASQLYGQHPLVVAFLGATCAAAGQTDRARQILDSFDEMSKSRFVPAVSHAIVHIGLRDKENVLKYLQQSAESRDAFLCWINVLPISQWLREDPRFNSILAAIGFRSA